MGLVKLKIIFIIKKWNLRKLEGISRDFDTNPDEATCINVSLSQTCLHPYASQNQGSAQQKFLGKSEAARGELVKPWTGGDGASQPAPQLGKEPTDPFPIFQHHSIQPQVTEKFEQNVDICY